MRSYIGYVMFNGEKWSVMNSTHSEQRAEQRALNINDMNLLVSMIADQLEESPKMMKNVLVLGAKRENIVCRDDVNDIVVVLTFDVKKRAIVVITCWSQMEGRILYGHAHSRLKIGWNLLITEKWVRLIQGLEDGSAKVFNRVENFEIGKIEDVPTPVV